MALNVLLLGGTGAMGHHLKELLILRGDNVFITSRKKHEDHNNVHYFQGDAHNPDFLWPLLEQGWDAIVDFMVYSTKEFELNINHLLSATHQYVFISSARVYANEEIPIRESSPRLLDCSIDKHFLTTTEYSLEKAREEDILHAQIKKNYTIIRPYITYSENRLQLGDLELSQWLERALQGRSIVFSEDIAEHTTTMTYGLDVAKGLAVIIGSNNALGEVYNITCGYSLKWREVLEIYLTTIENITGHRPNVKWIKNAMKLSIPATKYQVLYDRLFNRIFDNSKILQLEPSLKFITPEVGLKHCIEDYIKNRKQISISYLEEAQRDRICKEHIPLNKIKSIKGKLIYLTFRYLGVANIFRQIRKK